MPSPENTSYPDAPRLLFFGAHPDDAEFSGGLASLYRSRGYPVKLVSVTDGAAGHQSLSGPDLAAKRREEARSAASVIGAESQIWDFPDGRLQPSLEVRERIVCEMREFAADLVLTHRPCDYHPDHRAVGQAVMDAAYLVTVPGFARSVAALKRPPVIASVGDLFTKPVSLEPHIVIDVSSQIDTLTEMLHCHASQVYDWLPYNRQALAEVPTGAAERKAWLAAQVREQKRAFADRFRQRLVALLGDAGQALLHIEAYEISEYGRPLDPKLRARLFPWHAELA
jgi:LmbE family N-acetylglucosaminyl deacetylase